MSIDCVGISNSSRGRGGNFQDNTSKVVGGKQGVRVRSTGSRGVENTSLGYGVRGPGMWKTRGLMESTGVSE